MLVPDSVLHTLLQAAVSASQASHGWILRLEGQELLVVASAGERAGEILGLRYPLGSDAASFCVGSGQPFASYSSNSKMKGTIAPMVGQPPSSILCVPCEEKGTMVGAIQVADKKNAGSFDFDDVELISLMADIAGAALVQASRLLELPSPEALVLDLQALAQSDPARYSTVASVIGMLVSHG